MNSNPKRRWRMAAIDFLNPTPLMWDFENEPYRRSLMERYEITYTTPASCARQLETGEADLGLVPIAAYALIPGLRIIPGCTIASLDHVRSILLVARPPGISSIRSIATDTSSLTSNTHACILFSRLWKTRPNLSRTRRTSKACLLPLTLRC